MKSLEIASPVKKQNFDEVDAVVRAWNLQRFARFQIMLKTSSFSCIMIRRLHTIVKETENEKTCGSFAPFLNNNNNINTIR